VARKLKTIAAWINDNLPELEARTRASHCNTDRQPRGCRYITHKGKGRRGTLISVYRRTDLVRPIYTHDGAQTYRTNDEVERWLSDYVEGCHRGRHNMEGTEEPSCRVCRVTDNERWRLAAVAARKRTKAPRAADDVAAELVRVVVTAVRNGRDAYAEALAIIEDDRGRR
jgi:hypothetical protein